MAIEDIRIASLSDSRELLIVLVLAATALLSFVLHYHYQTIGTSRLPGPVGYPIIGNALQIPKDRQWLIFEQWRKLYGDIVHISVMGQPSIILGSFQAANELLDTRGTIYSDRPPAIMAGELVGWSRGLGYSPGPPNARFREFRRLFQQFMGQRALSAQSPIVEMQRQENIRFLDKMIRDPQKFFDHARDSTSALILQIAYGYTVVDNRDPLDLVKIAHDAMDGFARASEPGAFWVDSFPLLRYVPAWFPGGDFQRVARSMRKDLERLYDVPFNYVKEQLKYNTRRTKKHPPSFVSSYLEETKDSQSAEEEELIKAAGASLYSGGAETTPSAITSFNLAMTLNPYVQSRAQAELDALLGSEPTRLPASSDREDFPYINALVKEVWRWNPSVPLGLPHVVTRDDSYRGYFIKKGTVVWVNIWSILHDESTYPEPYEFRPERFLIPTEDGKVRLKDLNKAEDPAVAFGFGRRICPGLYLAENSVFLAIATILYVFRISKATDRAGTEITPQVEYDGFISHPRPFECSINPRSPEHETLVKQALEAIEDLE